MGGSVDSVKAAEAVGDIVIPSRSQEALFLSSIMVMGLGAAFTAEVVSEASAPMFHMDLSQYDTVMYVSRIFPRVFMTILSGVVIDRFNAAKAVATLVAFCVFVGSFLVALSPLVGGRASLFALGQMLVGSFSGALIVSQKMFVNNKLPGTTVGYYLALSVAVGYIGTLASWIFTPLFVDTPLGVDGAFWMGAVLCLGSAIATLYASLQMPPVVPEESLTVASGSRSLGFYVSRLANLGYFLTLLTTVAFFGSLTSFVTVLPSYLDGIHGITFNVAKVATCVLVSLAALLTPLFGRRVDAELDSNCETGSRHWWPVGSVQLWGSILTAAGFGVLSAIPGLWLPALIMLALGFAMVPSAVWPAIATFIPNESVGLGFGLAQALADFGSEVVRVSLQDLAASSPTYQHQVMPVLLSVSVVGALSAMALICVFAQRPSQMTPKPMAGVHSRRQVYAHLRSMSSGFVPDLEAVGDEQKASR